MKIIQIEFETPLTFTVSNQIVTVIAFKSPEPGNIKFGVEAPRAIKVHREEVYNLIKEQKLMDYTR